MCDTFLHNTNWQVDAAILIIVYVSPRGRRAWKIVRSRFSLPLHIPLRSSSLREVLTQSTFLKQKRTYESAARVASLWWVFVFVLKFQDSIIVHESVRSAHFIRHR